MSVTWDSSFKNKPTGSRSIGLGDDYIRETREAVEDRITKEHLLMSDTASDDGTHRRGSARCYVGASDEAPSPSTMEAEDEDDTSYAIGRMKFNTSLGMMMVYEGSAWAPVGACLGEVKAFGDAPDPTALVTAGFRKCNSDNEGAWNYTVNGATISTYVPDMVGKFVKGTATHATGGEWEEGDGLNYLTKLMLPAHDHDMDHGHKAYGDDDENAGTHNGFYLIKDPTMSWSPASGSSFLSSPTEPDDVTTEKTKTGDWGTGWGVDGGDWDNADDGEQAAIECEPANVELVYYCYVGPGATKVA